MYENNYNYIEEPEDRKPKGNAGKTVALILAVAIVGGASGFGGAYLQDMITAENNASVSESASVIKDGEIVTSTKPAPVPDNVVSSLLTPASPDGALTTKQIVEKAAPSVVGIHSEFENGSGTGTGIILSSDGYIITNAHVVQSEVRERVNGGGNSGGYSEYGDIFEYFFGGGSYGFPFDNGGSYQTVKKNAKKVSVVLSSDEETEYEAEIIGADENSDLAVLKIDAAGLELHAAEFGNSDELTMGDTAIAIGYPLGMGLSTSQGIISGLNRTLNIELAGGGVASMTLIQTDAAINPGNSGGPLVNAYGQVIGITSSKMAQTSVEGMGFAIPITDAMPLISDLMNKGYIESAQIGITGTDINSAVMRYYNLPVDKGVMVAAVSEGSGAAEAGITPGDVIVGADGKEIATMSELTAAKSGKAVGDKMTLTLARADGNVDVEIILTGEIPETQEEASEE